MIFHRVNHVSSFLKTATFLAFAALGTACGTLVGNGSEEANSAPAADIIVSDSILTFDASASNLVTRAVSFNNGTGEPVTITKLVFAGNVCADFSLDGIYRTDGVLLADGNSFSSYSVGEGQEVNINIRYIPSNCVYSGYQTTLYIYYQSKGEGFVDSALLQPSGSGGGVFACEHIQDHTAEYVETGLTGPEDGHFYLRVDRMRGYMYVPSAAGTLQPSQLAVGTDINGLLPEDYIPAFLEMDIAGTSATLYEITDKMDFCLASPDDNFIFGGAYSQLLSTAAVEGKLDADGGIYIEDVNVQIVAKGIPEDVGLHVDVDGIFQISVLADLTTGAIPTDFSDSNIVLGMNEAASQLDDDGESLLPVEKDDEGRNYLMGSVIDDGRMTLVGLGKFINTDGDFIGTEQASSFLIEKVAYLYLMMDITVVDKVGE